MRALDLPLDHLRLLDDSLDGMLHPALERAIASGGDPELTVLRKRPNPGRPSSWGLRVVTAGQVAEVFDVAPTNLVALGIAAQIWLVDVTSDVQADLRALLREAAFADVGLDERIWTRPDRGSC